MCDFIVCPEDGKVYSYQDFVQKIYLESVPEEEKRAFENMSAIKEEAWNQETVPFVQMDERIDLYSENLARKMRHKNRRKRKNFTVGEYERYKERKDKRREAWIHKKMGQKNTYERLLDRMPGWIFDSTVKDLSAKETEAEARKNAKWDLTHEQMEFCGEMYKDLIYHRDVNEAKYHHYEEVGFQLHCQESALLDEIEELAVKLSALNRKLGEIRQRSKDANRGEEYHKKLYETYKDMVINEVLGIEDN